MFVTRVLGGGEMRPLGWDTRNEDRNNKMRVKTETPNEKDWRFEGETTPGSRT